MMKQKLLMLVMIAVALIITTPVAIAEIAPLSPQMTIVATGNQAQDRAQVAVASVAQNVPVARIIAVENVASVENTGNQPAIWVQVAVENVASVENTIPPNIVTVANTHYKKITTTNDVQDVFNIRTTTPAIEDDIGNTDADLFRKTTTQVNVTNIDDTGGGIATNTKMDERSGQKIDANNMGEGLATNTINTTNGMDEAAYNTSENTGGLKTGYGGNHHKAVTLKLPLLSSAPTATWTTTQLND
ncbi:MAG: hypothetical protein WCV86_02150 [Patescibacteria group bacterium]|jgi:hypothetical protein